MSWVNGRRKSYGNIGNLTALQKFSVSLISIFVSDKNILEYIHFEILVNYFFVLLTPRSLQFSYSFSSLRSEYFTVIFRIFHRYYYIIFITTFFNFYSINNYKCNKNYFTEIEESIFKIVSPFVMESKKIFI